MSNTTSPILDCLYVEGVPIITWVENLIIQVQTQVDALKARMTTAEADIVTIKSQIAALQALLTALQACCNSIQQYIANNHKALVVTKTQDVANRLTFDAINQILNLPPIIRAQIISNSTTPLNQGVPDTGVLTPLLNVFPDFETAPDMTAQTYITIPKTGRYHLNGSWATNLDEPNAIDGYSIGMSFAINGPSNIPGGAGRFTAPFLKGRVEQVAGLVPAVSLIAGDQVSILAFTDYPGGVTAIAAYLFVEYLDGI